jgi:hypothetical protein
MYMGCVSIHLLSMHHGWRLKTFSKTEKQDKLTGDKTEIKQRAKTKTKKYKKYEIL